jgi:anti-sigma factor RsiW
MATHPSEARLALFAGGELGRWRRWAVERHLAECAECRREVSDFSALRAGTAALNDLPEVAWDRLGAEMKANIRVGLEAGECVTEKPAPTFVFSPRALAACVSLVALLAASVFLERPAPRAAEVKLSEPVLETTGAGIKVTDGQQSITLLNQGGSDVHYTATGNAMRARYVDAKTGNVTINTEYVE